MHKLSRVYPRFGSVELAHGEGEGHGNMEGGRYAGAVAAVLLKIECL